MYQRKQISPFDFNTGGKRKKTNIAEYYERKNAVKKPLNIQEIPLPISENDLGNVPSAILKSVVDPTTGFLMDDPYTSLKTGETYDLTTIEKLILNGEVEDIGEFCPNYRLKAICEIVDNNYHNPSFDWIEAVQKDIEDPSTLDTMETPILTREGISHDLDSFSQLQRKTHQDPITKRNFDEFETTVENRPLKNIIEFVQMTVSQKELNIKMQEIEDQFPTEHLKDLSDEEIEKRVQQGDEILKEAHEQLERLNKEALTRQNAPELKDEKVEMSDEEIEKRVQEADEILKEAYEQLDRLDKERAERLSRQQINTVQDSSSEVISQQDSEVQRPKLQKEKLEEDGEVKRKEERLRKEHEQELAYQKRKEERLKKEQEQELAYQERKKEREKENQNKMESEKQRKEENKNQKQKEEKILQRNAIEREKIKREQERYRLKREAERAAERSAVVRLSEKKDQEKKIAKAQEQRHEHIQLTRKMEEEENLKTIQKLQEKRVQEEITQKEERENIQQKRMQEEERHRENMEKYVEERNKKIEEEELKHKENIVNLKNKKEQDEKKRVEAEKQRQEEKREDANIESFLKTQKFPEALINAIKDPMTGLVMREPVTLKNGQVRERKEVERQGLKEGGDFIEHQSLKKIIDIIRQDYRGGIPKYETMEELRVVYKQMTDDVEEGKLSLDKNLRDFFDYFQKVEAENKRMAEEELAAQQLEDDQKFAAYLDAQQFPVELINAVKDSSTGLFLHEPVTVIGGDEQGNDRERRALENQGQRVAFDFIVNKELQVIIDILRKNCQFNKSKRETLEELYPIYQRISEYAKNPNFTLDKNLTQFCNYFQNQYPHQQKSYQISDNVKGIRDGLADINKRAKSSSVNLTVVGDVTPRVVSTGGDSNPPSKNNLTQKGDHAQSQPSRWSNFKQWVKKHKTKLIVAAVVIGVIVVASVVTFGVATAVGITLGGGAAALGAGKVLAGTALAAKIGGAALGAKGIAITAGAAAGTGVSIGSTAYMLSKSDDDADLAPLSMPNTKEKSQNTNVTSIGGTLFNNVPDEKLGTGTTGKIGENPSSKSKGNGLFN